MRWFWFIYLTFSSAGGFLLLSLLCLQSEKCLLSIFVWATERFKLVVMNLPVSNYGIKNPHTPSLSGTQTHTKMHWNKDLNTCFQDLCQVVTLGENFLSTLCSYSAHRAEALKQNSDSVKSKTICQRFFSQPSVICMYLLCVRQCLISDIFLLRHLWNLKTPYWSFYPSVWVEVKHRAADGPQAPPTRFTLVKCSESTGLIFSIQRNKQTESSSDFCHGDESGASFTSLIFWLNLFGSWQDGPGYVAKVRTGPLQLATLF